MASKKKAEKTTTTTIILQKNTGPTLQIKASDLKRGMQIVLDEGGVIPKVTEIYRFSRDGLRDSPGYPAVSVRFACGTRYGFFVPADFVFKVENTAKKKEPTLCLAVNVYDPKYAFKISTAPLAGDARAAVSVHQVVDGLGGTSEEYVVWSSGTTSSPTSTTRAVRLLEKLRSTKPTTKWFLETVAVCADHMQT